MRDRISHLLIFRDRHIENEINLQNHVKPRLVAGASGMALHAADECVLSNPGFKDQIEWGLRGAAEYAEPRIGDHFSKACLASLRS
jgi:hypothetical protein